MKLAQRAHTLAIAFLAAAPFFLPAMSGSALARPAIGLTGIETQFSATADLLLSSQSADAARAGPYGDIHLDFTAEHMREDGIRLGLTLGAVARADSGRRGLSRQFGSCPPALADCAAISGLPVSGVFTGLHAVTAIQAAGPRAGLEIARLYVRAPLFEAELGYGPGAAQQEAIALPGALRLARADGALVDPSGRSIVSTANMLSGHAPKLTVRSRRIIGLRLAGSFTPQADMCGINVCRPEHMPGVLAAAEVSRVAEGAVSFDHRFAATGIRWKAFLTAARGEAGGPLAGEFRDPWAMSGGVQMETGPWATGLSALVSNDGLAGVRYRAQAASISYERGDWLFSAELGEAQSTLVHGRSRSALLAASHYFEPGIILGFGLSHTQAGFAVVPAGSRVRDQRSGTQFFIETGLRF